MKHRPALVAMVALLAASLSLSGCSIPGEAAPVLTPTSEPSIATATPSPPTTVTPIPAPTATPIPTAVPSPAPSPTPEPTATTVPVPDPIIVSNCCGVFSWVDEGLLIVYDAQTGAPGGSSVIDVYSGERSHISNKFGSPNGQGLIAVAYPAAGTTEILDLSGARVSEVRTGGAPVWISPEGSRIAWLGRLPERTRSSAVNRAVRLWVADVDGANARPVMDLQAAELHWLPDEQRIIVAGRTLEGADSGVWVIDVVTGDVRVLVDATFPQAVQVSPDGRLVAYMVTLSGDEGADGVWIAEIDGDQRWQTTLREGFRWGADSQSLWTVQLAPRDEGLDRLIRVALESGDVLDEVMLRSRVQNHEWAMSPDDRAVAYWREEDSRVMVEFIRP